MKLPIYPYHQAYYCYAKNNSVPKFIKILVDQKGTMSYVDNIATLSWVFEQLSTLQLVSHFHKIGLHYSSISRPNESKKVFSFRSDKVKIYDNPSGNYRRISNFKSIAANYPLSYSWIESTLSKYFTVIKNTPTNIFCRITYFEIQPHIYDNRPKFFTVKSHQKTVEFVGTCRLLNALWKNQSLTDFKNTMRHQGYAYNDL